MDLDNIFSYHPVKAGQPELYAKLRLAAKTFAKEIDDCVPDGADKTAAIRKVREAVMTANAGIALEGRL